MNVTSTWSYLQKVSIYFTSFVMQNLLFSCLHIQVIYQTFLYRFIRPEAVCTANTLTLCLGEKYYKAYGSKGQGPRNIILFWDAGAIVVQGGIELYPLWRP